MAPITYKGPPPEDQPKGDIPFGDAESVEAALNAIATSDDPEAAAREFAERLGASAGADDSDLIHPPAPAEPRPFSAIGLVFALVGAVGIAAAITVLYNGMAVIMETSGGFVALGGPYEIAHPAPPWVWILPLSIFGIVIFGSLSIVAAGKGWGVNPSLFAWSGLFIALGWNFLRFGVDPPSGMQGAWAWIVCGVLFWIMGFGPWLLAIGWFRQGYRQLIARQSNPDARRVWTAPRRGDTTGVYIAAQVIGVGLGIWAGIALFSAVTGL